jgi:hypothetical protein
MVKVQTRASARDNQPFSGTVLFNPRQNGRPANYG